MKSIWQRVQNFFAGLWKSFSRFSRRTQIIIVVVALVAVVGSMVLLRSSSKVADANATPIVTVQSLGSFSLGADSVDVLGTIQSESEADILAQSGGNVTAVNTTVGANVPAGFVIANLDSSSASAGVIQAQGAYDAAVAAEQITNFQSSNSTGTFAEQQTSARNTYTSTYTTLESALTVDVDTFFGNGTPVGPALLINPLTTNDEFPRGRAAITNMMSGWQSTLATVDTTDPLTLLSTAQTNLNTVQAFLTNLEALATQPAANASQVQLADLATAQSTVSGLIASISSARNAYNAAETAAQVGQTQSGTGRTGSSGVSSSQASVEVALGGLRAAQAAYEKTVIRAPIGGTINYLPIHVGDYVSMNQHVATVAHNDALKVVTYLSQDQRNRITVGDTLNIIGADASGNPTTYQGVVTIIAPALDPTTQQIEVDIAVNAGQVLLNGQSVQVELPSINAAASAGSATISAGSTTSASTTSSTTPSIEVPLTAVKLLPNERDLFTVDSTGHLVAHAVDIGDVIGNNIQILTPLDPSLMVVTDARGLSAGDAVTVASSTQSQ
jgi:multidrug efflux pump subunit AcrA (membrane-fusion protein)